MSNLASNPFVDWLSPRPVNNHKFFAVLGEGGPTSRPRRAQSRKKEARDLPALVCDWLTEGFDIAVVKEATSLIDEPRLMLVHGNECAYGGGVNLVRCASNNRHEYRIG